MGAAPQQPDRLQILSEALQAFAEATAAPETLFEAIARRTAGALDAACGFTLLSADGAWLDPVAYHTHDPVARPQLEVVELARVGDEVKDIVRGLADERQVGLTVEIEAALPPVTVDPRMLKQVLYNFLSNAIKFTPDGGRVALRIAAEGERQFRVDVEDTGIGIRAEDLEAHGGRVGVVSTPGRGSTFTAILPRIAQLEEAR